MDFVVLTNADGERVVVNWSNVAYFESAGSEADGCRIYFNVPAGDGAGLRFITVQETLDETLELLDEEGDEDDLGLGVPELDLGD